jgi:phospholipase C
MAPNNGYTRRTFLKKSGAAGVAVLGGTLWATAPAAARARGGRFASPIKHLIVGCQENRSFDHYFGYAPQVQAKGYGPPRGYTLPDDTGGQHAPFEFTATSTPDIPHWWQAVHDQYNGGKMDGFYRVAQTWSGDGNLAIGYYTARELPFYYSLFRNSGLCANYFCSLLGPTWPNRFYLMSGTSGGITTNGLWGYGIFDSARWPIILDLLDKGDVSWKIYYIGFDGVEVGDTDNVAVFWSRWAHDRGRRRPSTTTSRTAGVGRCQTSRGSSRASRCSSTSIPTRTSASAWASRSRSSQRCSARGCGTSPRSSSPTTSTVVSSTTSRRRRSMRTASASECRSG